jgi:pimeloyl-ACP methyl ester carboxylesterase
VRLQQREVDSVNRLAFAILVLLLVVPCSGSGDGPTELMVSVGSHSLHAVVAGEGAPPVVFDGGIGARSDEYRVLQDRIAAITTTVVYDRAGYGASEVGPLPRDSKTEVEELRRLLAALDIQGPYVLVGHSLGGLNAEVFSSLHPEEVAGLVLLDPPPMGFIRREDYPQLVSMASQMTDEWQRIADAGLESQNAQERAEAGFFEMLASEHREMFGASALEASSASFGDIPLVVVASGVANPAFGEIADEYQHYWVAQSEALSAKSSRGEFILAEESGHMLQQEAPDLVVDVVLSMVDSLRGAGR